MTSLFFRDILNKFGLWDQIRVDHGREWYLFLFIHHSLAHLRSITEKAAFIQTTSTKVFQSVIILLTYSYYFARIIPLNASGWR